MRLIGIQALLTLLEEKKGATASASGLGDGHAVSNAGAFAQSHGIGSAQGVSSINEIAVHAGGIGGANGIGVTIGVLFGFGASGGHGDANAVGSTIGLVAVPGSANGIGAASGIGQILNVATAVASASGTGSSSFVGQILAIVANGSAAGTGAAVAVGATVHFVRVTQDYIEVVNNGDPSTQVARVTHSYIEVVMAPNYIGAGSASGSGAANGIGVTTGTVLGVGTSSGLGGASANAVSATEDDVPNGRLTLSTGVPVMTLSVTGATTVYFTPYKGNKALVTTDGINFLSQTFTELSQTTADATKSPAAVAASKIYDMFVWSDGGTLRCTRGPAWSSDTSRGTGAGTSELQLVSGIYTNKNAITNGPGVGLGVYVGSIRSNGSSTIDFNLGGSASGGSAGSLYVWNYFNRVLALATSVDSAASYTYTTGTARQANANAGNQINFLSGLAEDSPSATAEYSLRTTGNAGAQCYAGVALDSTSSFSAPYQRFSTAYSVAGAVIQSRGSVSLQVLPQLGVHYMARIEQSDGTHANSFNDNAGDSLQFSMPM